MKKSRKMLRPVPWALGALPLAALVFLGAKPALVLQHLGPVEPWLSAGLQRAYGAPLELATEPSPAPVGVAIAARPLRQLDARFLSVAIDTSVLLGGRWWSASGRVEVGRGSERTPPLDLSQPALQVLARGLAPAYLRVGGTEADRVQYAFGAAAAEPLRAPNELVLDATRWAALHEFARAARLDLFFTVNAGPGARGAAGEWLPESLEALLAHARAHGQHAKVWELGNEVNAHWFIHGLGAQPSAERYAADLQLFREIVRRYAPGARVAGPALAYFPLLGEPMPARAGFVPGVLAQAGAALDILSWHYYPQQSRRCPIATRRAAPGQLLGPAALEEWQRWSEELAEQRDRWAPRAELWLGETGSAQCGGEPGLSDRFASGLWWLDQLGGAARAGQSIVIRQALIGSDYGLLDADTLAPRPDYFASLAWKRWLGPRVLEVSLSAGNRALRAYAHCSARDPERAVLLALNVDATEPAAFVLQGRAEHIVRFDFSAPEPGSSELFVNGTRAELVPGPSGSLEWLEPAGRRVGDPTAPLTLAPASYTFFELRGPVAAPCHSSDPPASSSASAASAPG